MPTQVFLISETKLREFTDINNNVDTELLKNGIREAQDIHLQRLTGTALYQKLLTDVSGSTLSGNYQYLVDTYIQDQLLYAAYYECLEAIYIRPRNNGLLTPTGGDNSREVDLQVYNMKSESVKNKMEWYAERLVNYLIESQNLFPELNQNNFLYQQNPDYGSQFRSPIVFRDAVRGSHLKQAIRTGLPITDSRYPQFPPPSVKEI